jgi:hypothetical protein
MKNKKIELRNETIVSNMSNTFNTSVFRMDADNKIYQTLDNGGQPFTVEISSQMQIVVWATDRTYRADPYLKFTASSIFIGTNSFDVCTKFSGVFSFQKEGDEITNDYYHIGYEIFKFRTFAPIIFYTSPVSYSAVPCPWAQDVMGNLYLMVANAVLTKVSHELAVNDLIKEKERYEPYFLLWFREKVNSEQTGQTGLQQFSVKHPVTGKMYKFVWCHNPEEAFDQQLHYYSDQLDGLTLGKDFWCHFIRAYGKQVGLYPLEIIEKISGRIV